MKLAKSSRPYLTTQKRKWLFGFSIFQKKSDLAQKIRKTNQDRLEAIAMANDPEIVKAFSATLEAEENISMNKFENGPKFPNFKKAS
ncbi:MAG: hypothetical protein HOC91_06170 [Nitrospinaceae bacterium]|jgi:CRISPR/Cas system endoribonuclease Cas6 (RAMP superfamily)|nr:hypothetical protein [Nitrospinaceae bacterium]MBT3434674.1 hypothetical protein [Nitrospinaceae bacterium]MBT3821364.1 hypothetical protein [Nitrospinaceae bacterium]MBT4095924.1 hypothetical protein [Nitrospinaceae bacterium]MBT4430084.1 hypothetical protein [Nitrospinaceae bacterium]